jgi:hypothetical protein
VGRLWLLSIPVLASATTLEKLTLDRMTAQSTRVVRARTGNCSAAFRGPVIYTTCQLKPTEFWKGPQTASIDVSIPGGASGGVRQSYSAAPSLKTGEEYVFFLWTSSKGVTHIIGLTQGLVSIVQSHGQAQAFRLPAEGRMLDGEGRAVRDEGLDMTLAELRARVTGKP